MALTFTRRPGESFTLTWPTGEQRVITVEDIGTKGVYVHTGPNTAHLDPLVIRHNTPLTVGVQGDKALAEIGIAIGCQLPGAQVKLYVDAPKSIHVLRDNAKRREAKS